MRCVSCGADVPPQYVKAIETNICPACGDSILTDESKQLLFELSEAMSNMPNDPQGVAGWLLSNYRIKKIGSAEPVEKFYGRGKSSNKLDEDGEPLSNDYNQFLSRTDMANRVKQAKLAAKRAREKNHNEEDDEDFDDITDEDIDTYQALVTNSKMKQTNAPLSLNDIMAIQAGQGEGSFDAEELGGDFTQDELNLMKTPKGQEFVMKNRMKRIQAQSSFEEEGRKIKFSRS